MTRGTKTQLICMLYFVTALLSRVKNLFIKVSALPGGVIVMQSTVGIAQPSICTVAENVLVRVLLQA